MKLNFTIKDDGSLPVVRIDGARLSIVMLTYIWQTRTDAVFSDANKCVVDGYFEGNTVLRRFLFDILTGAVTEEPIEIVGQRVFEVYIAPTTFPEIETWEVRAFQDLKVGDIIRIKDAGQYHRDLDGCGVWTVTDTTRLTKGFIDVLPYTCDAHD